LDLGVLPGGCHGRSDRRGHAERRFQYRVWVYDPHSVCRVLKDALRDLDRRRGRRQVMKLGLVLGIRPLGLRLAAALLLLAVNCTAPSAPAPPPPQTAAALPDAPQPTSLPAQTGPARDALAYPGKVQVRWSVDVTPRVTGRIEQLPVDVGSSVEAGDLIAVLEHAQLDAAVQQAAGELQAAEAHLRKLRAGPPPEGVEAARAQLETAAAKQGQLQADAPAGSVATAQTNLASAQAQLAATAAKVQADVLAAQGDVDAARATVATNRVQLEQLLGGGAPAEQAAADAAVDA